MRRSNGLALGALMAALWATPPVLAQDAGQQGGAPAVAEPGTTTAPTKASSPKVQARKVQALKASTSKGPARKVGRARGPAASEQAQAAEPYELVPSRTGSALVRARQNAFGVRDEEGSSSGVRSRHIGIGLGGGNGMTPGMAIGF